MVIFTDADGQAQRGEVWCPGPRPDTVWALTPSGRAVVLHVDKLTEQPAPIDPRNWQDLPCSIVGQPDHASPHCRCGDAGAQVRYLLQFRYAEPAVSGRKLRALAGLF
jgi:hypothetical protein